MSALLLAGLLACGLRKPAEVMVEFPVLETPVEVPASGVLVDGRFVDAVHGMSIMMQAGWKAELGSFNDALRLRLLHQESGAVLELWAFSARLAAPAPRPDCTWQFQDQGLYTTIPSSELQMVATCTPDDPLEPRVLAWLVMQGPTTWQVELHTPADGFMAARQAGATVLQTIRF